MPVEEEYDDVSLFGEEELDGPLLTTVRIVIVNANEKDFGYNPYNGDWARAGDNIGRHTHT